MKVFLIGMMGSGKSYWGKLLAKKLKCGAYDLDYLVESAEEKTIAEMFEEDGEDHFRKNEAKILRWFAKRKFMYFQLEEVPLAFMKICNG